MQILRYKCSPRIRLIARVLFILSVVNRPESRSVSSSLESLLSLDSLIKSLIKATSINQNSVLADSRRGKKEPSAG